MQLVWRFGRRGGRPDALADLGSSSSSQRPRHPHFKHNFTKEILWMDSRDNLSWVAEEHVSFCGSAAVVEHALSLSLIFACCKNKDLRRGIKIHDELQKRGLMDQKYSDALATMYAKCGDPQKAQTLLDMYKTSNIIPWTALIASYAREGKGQKALDCFQRMQCKDIRPNEVTYVCILKACAAIRAIAEGKKIHEEISRQGLLKRHVALGGALVDMYAKCGALHQAQRVLEKLPFRNVVSWSALITGYVQSGQGQQALDCCEQMEREGILPNEVTYACSLKACAAIGAIDKGKKVHDKISRQGLLEHDIVLGGALVDMYAKCGALRQAQTVLEKLPSRNVALWGALIAGYGQIGQGRQALECFEQMQREGILPDVGAFCCLLNLCRHLGLVEKGQELFDSMEAVYGLKPDAAILNCMVDLLGRAGHLEKAVEVIQGMPSSVDLAIWHGLLCVCMKWTDVNMATWAFEQAVQLDKGDVAGYVLMVKYMRQLVCQRRQQSHESKEQSMECQGLVTY